MTQPYECEVRLKIDCIEDFKAILTRLRARIVLPYEFTDYYYKPADKSWDPFEKNLRIREWVEPPTPTTIYFVKLEIMMIQCLRFKRSLYPEGKLPLFSGSLDTCRSLLEDLGFVFWFALRKEKARLWEIPDHHFFTAVEYIRGLGWTAELEFEGQAPKQAAQSIQQALELLDVPLGRVTHKPISAIYLENVLNKDGFLSPNQPMAH
jgi:adenylate cyclase class IV